MTEAPFCLPCCAEDQPWHLGFIFCRSTCTSQKLTAALMTQLGVTCSRWRNESRLLWSRAGEGKVMKQPLS